MADLFKLWRHSKVVVPLKHKYDANDLVHDMHKEAKARRADKKKYAVELLEGSIDNIEVTTRRRTVEITVTE